MSDLKSKSMKICINRWLYGLVLLQCMLGCAMANAAKDKAVARRAAIDFLSGKSAVGMVLKANAVNEVEIGTDGSYAFNVGRNGGFVIVNVDSEQQPQIIGYADSGSITADCPKELKQYLNGLHAEIASTNQTKTPALLLKSATFRKTVVPIVHTEWSQDEPFNLLCPTDGGERCLTGCVATALAQIFYTLEYPSKTHKAVPAYVEESGGNNQREALPVTSFDYKSMRLGYERSEDLGEAGNVAVAKLMKYVGHATQMTYKTDGSAAKFMGITPLLDSIFGYSALQYMERAYYTTTKWVNTIHEELEAGRPVLYGGCLYDGYGHAFVVDGYDGADKYHINWGWGGRFNGYYMLSGLTPSNDNLVDMNAGYNMTHHMIVGFAVPDAIEPQAMLLGEFMDIEDSQVFVYNFYNTGAVASSFSVSIATMTPQGKLVQAAQVVNTEVLGHDEGVQARFGLSLAALLRMESLSNNVIYPVYRLPGETEWHIAGDPSLVASYVDVSSGRKVTAHREVSLEGQYVGTAGAVTMGETFRVDSKIANMSPDLGYKGIVVGMLVAKGDTFVTQDYLGIDPGETLDVPLYVQPQTSGAHEFYLFDKDGNTLLGTQINVGSKAENADNLTAVIDVDNISTGTQGLVVNSFDFGFTVTIKNSGDGYRGKLDCEFIVLYRKNEGMKYDMSEFSEDAVIPAKGAVSVHMKAPDLTNGTVEINLKAGDKKLATTSFIHQNTGHYLKNTMEVEGIAQDGYIEVPEDVVAVHLENAGAEKVQSVANNCFYYIDSQNLASLREAEKTQDENLFPKTNVVVNDSSEFLYVDLGKDYMMENEILAKEANIYIRMPEPAADGNCYALVFFPFEPQELPTDPIAPNGEDVTFLRPVEMDGKAVKWEKTEKVKPYNTYIVKVPATSWPDDDRTLLFMSSEVFVPASMKAKNEANGDGETGLFVGQTLGGTSAAPQQGLNGYVFAPSLPGFVKANGSEIAVQPFTPVLWSTIDEAQMGLKMVSDGVDKVTAGHVMNGYADVFTALGVKAGRVLFVDGQPVTTGLKPGLYFGNGQKFMVEK